MFSLALATESIVLSGKKGNARVQLSSCRTAVELGFGFLRQDGFREHLKKKKKIIFKNAVVLLISFSVFLFYSNSPSWPKSILSAGRIKQSVPIGVMPVFPDVWIPVITMSI